MIQFESLNKYNKLWLTSDTHAYHRNMVKGVSSWDDGYRDFDTVEQMNDALVAGINSNVGHDDVLVHCGDWSFAGKDKVLKFYDRLACRNVIFTPGNHCHHIRNKELSNWFNNVLPINDIQYIQYKGKQIVCSHYPQAIWHQSHKGSLHAFGHVHGSYPGLGKSFDVGVDNAFKLLGEYRPFSFEEFISFADRREAHLESHHNSNTN